MTLIKKFTDKEANIFRINDTIQLKITGKDKPVKVVIEELVLGDGGILVKNKLDGKNYEWPYNNISMIVFKDEDYKVTTKTMTKTMPRTMNNLFPTESDLEIYDTNEEDIDTTIITLRKQLNDLQDKLSDVSIKIAYIWDAEANGVPVDYNSDEYIELQASQYALSVQIKETRDKIHATYNGGI